MTETGTAAASTEAAVHAKYETITKLLIKNNITITTMESCTSGQVASLLTFFTSEGSTLF